MNRIAKTLVSKIGEGALVGFHPCEGQHFFGSAFHYDIGTTETERGFVIVVPGDKEFFHAFLKHFEAMPLPKLPDVGEEKPVEKRKRSFFRFPTWWSK